MTFEVKFNCVLGDFASVKSILRHELVMKYCTYFFLWSHFLKDFADWKDPNSLYKQFETKASQQDTNVFHMFVQCSQTFTNIHTQHKSLE